MDRRRLIMGASLMVLVFGLILLGFTEGGMFNPVIPYIRPSSFGGPPRAHEGYQPALAHRDLSKPGPAVGLVLMALGAIGLIYSWAVKVPE